MESAGAKAPAITSTGADVCKQSGLIEVHMEECPLLKLFQHRVTLKNLETKERVSIPLEEWPEFVRAALLYPDVGPGVLYFVEQDRRMHISSAPIRRRRKPKQRGFFDQ